LALKTPFLDPDYQAVTKPMPELDVTKGLLADVQAISPVRGLVQLNRVAGQTSSRHRFMKDKASKLPKRLKSPEDLDASLQYDAAATVMQDVALEELTDILARVTGQAEVTEPESAARGHDLGHDFIDRRSQHAASTALGASALLYSTWKGTGITESVWDRTRT